MDIYQCSVCGHVEFDDAPMKCLVCQSTQESFAEKPGAITKPEDPNNLTDGDKKHIPQMVVVKDCGLLDDCTDVHVKVGKIPHVMTPKHYIMYIDVYLDHRFITRTWLSPEVCHAAVGLHLNATSGKLTALQHCNVHGIWMSETDL